MSAKTAGIVMAIGGAMMAVGSFLTFASFETPAGSQSFTGLAPEVGNDGKIFLGLGIALVVFGVVVMAVGSVVIRRILGVLGILAAGFMAFVGIVDITTIEDGIPAQLIGQVSITAGIGLYLATAGSVIGVIGSGMGIFARAPEAAPMAPPPPPPAGEPPPEPPPG